MPKVKALPLSLMVVFLATAGGVYLLGVVTNGLIISVNLSDWSTGRNLMPNEEILASLALSNLCLSTTLIVDYFCSVVWDEFYSLFHNVQRVVFTLDIALSFSTFWVSAWLSVFYCMKIVSFKRPFLLRMKLKFSTRVRWLLLGSVSVSLGVAFLFQWTAIAAIYREKAVANQTASLPLTFNCTGQCVIGKVVFIHMHPLYRILILFLGCSFPFITVISSSVPVLCSLVRHTRNLEENRSPFRLEAHLNAAKAVLCLLLCDVLFFASQVLVRMEIYPNWTREYFLCLTAQLTTLWAQSAILIRSNPKLKQGVRRHLACLPGRNRNRNTKRPTGSQGVENQHPSDISVTVRQV